MEKFPPWLHGPEVPPVMSRIGTMLSSGNILASAPNGGPDDTGQGAPSFTMGMILAVLEIEQVLSLFGSVLSSTSRWYANRASFTRFPVSREVSFSWPTWLM